MIKVPCRTSDDCNSAHIFMYDVLSLLDTKHSISAIWTMKIHSPIYCSAHRQSSTPRSIDVAMSPNRDNEHPSSASGSRISGEAGQVEAMAWLTLDRLC